MVRAAFVAVAGLVSTLVVTFAGTDAASADLAQSASAFGGYVSDGYVYQSWDATHNDLIIYGRYGWVLANGTMPSRGATTPPRISGIPTDIAVPRAGWVQHDLYYRDPGNGTLHVDHGCGHLKSNVDGFSGVTYCDDPAYGATDDLKVAIASSPSGGVLDGVGYVYARLPDNSLGVYHNRVVDRLGGVFVGDPITVVRAREIDTFVVNSQNQVWDYVNYGNQVSGWRFVRDLGPGHLSNLTAGAMPNGHIGFAVLISSTTSTVKYYATWSMLSPADQQSDSSDFSNYFTTSGVTSGPVVLGATMYVQRTDGSIVSGPLGTDPATYARASDVAIPSPSASHYLRTVDNTTLRAVGVNDASVDATSSGTHIHLFHTGAQTTKTLPAPGVLLSGTSTRVTDEQVVAGIKQYIDGYRSKSTSGTATIIVGTNSDGYPSSDPNFGPSAKGTDWAINVVNALRAVASTGITILGGNDIEAGFSAALSDVKTWETSYLTHTTANLVYNGSLDACPDTFGTSADCQSVTGGPSGTNAWKRADYVQLTYSLSPGRIQVLPQIYFSELPNQAVQWANVDLTSGRKLQFIGALTEQATGCSGACDLSPRDGWTALRNALSAVPTTVPAAVTDLDVVT